jgi:hypothetical protein
MVERGQADPALAGATPAVADVDTETAKAARELAEVVRQTELAAREWGVRPDHLEGRFVSALLGCLTWLGRIMQAALSDMKASAKDTRAAATAELETLRTASKTALRVLQQAETALAGSDVQRQMAVGKFVETVTPQLVKAIGEAVVIRERRYNQTVHWGRAAGIATLAGGLLLGGYVWGSWRPDNAVIAGQIALDRIRQCEAAPVRDDRTKEAFCPMKLLLAPS